MLTARDKLTLKGAGEQTENNPRRQTQTESDPQGDFRTASADKGITVCTAVT